MMRLCAFFRTLICLLSVALVIVSCSSEKYLSEGEYLLDRTVVHPSSLDGYIRQHPNQRWFSAVKVPLGIWLMAGKKEGRFRNMIRRMGEAPVIYDSLQSGRSAQQMQDAVRAQGYLHAKSSYSERTKRHKMRVRFDVDYGPRYSIRDLSTEVRDSDLLCLIEPLMSETLLYEGMPFDANILDEERRRIASKLNSVGYYHFNKDHISFLADTTLGNHQVAVTMVILPFSQHGDTITCHKIYLWGETTFKFDTTARHPLHLREKVLRGTVAMKPGTLYSERDVQNTYGRLIRLGALAASNIQLEERDSNKIYPHITLTPARLNTVKFGLDGTNSSGDLGVAAEVTYQNRNIFHGSELLTIKARGAFEAIRQLKGYDRQNFIEYSFEASLTFPNFMFPGLNKWFHSHIQATSEVSLKFDSQDRPEFHRRVVTGALRYRWGRYNGKHQYRWDLLGLNYVYMPWISDTFRRTYLDNPTSRNAILRYNYENLFIMNWAFTFNYSSVHAIGAMGIYGKDGFTTRVSLETAGNLLHGLCSAFSSSRNSDGQRTLLGIAYAQYAKVDLDFTRSVRLSEGHSFAFHAGLGLAYPYGNANILPYEKRYFSGGANSVRGWSVRELGPGRFRGTDGRIDFINQTGDIKLDLNVEYRAHLFWKMDGALFLDAGNIWTFRDYDDQPGGQFSFSRFWREIAVSYGMGIRFNFNYFLLRLDAGMKAINPAFEDTRRHYPLVYPKFSRDFTFHFAVGLPF